MSRIIEGTLHAPEPSLRVAASSSSTCPRCLSRVVMVGCKQDAVRCDRRHRTALLDALTRRGTCRELLSLARLVDVEMAVASESVAHGAFPLSIVWLQL
jgi:hypothetical protein